MKELYMYLCTVTHPPSLLPPPPFPNHILLEFYTLFLTKVKTYNIASPPQTKMTSKDDIEGLVSVKFLRPCAVYTKYW